MMCGLSSEKWSRENGKPRNLESKGSKLPGSQEKNWGVELKKKINKFILFYSIVIRMLNMRFFLLTMLKSTGHDCEYRGNVLQ